MLDARTISVSVDRPWRDVYEAVWRPEDFPRWASGLSQAELTRDGDVWRARGAEGPVTIRFTPHNIFGIMDHHVGTERGVSIDVPLRIIANQAGALVQLTLFRQPDMTDEIFARDVAWVERDLAALKRLVTG